MQTRFKIPILLFLILLISKEVFSYESEKVVILCILSFIIIAYYNTREAFAENFSAKSSKLEEEFASLFILKRDLERNIKSFWRVFLDLEDQLLVLYHWINKNIKTFLKRYNENRSLFLSHLIKDELALLLHDQHLVNHGVRLYLIKNSINNLRLVFSNNIESNLLYAKGLNFNFFLNKLKSLTYSYNISHLILNKLNINKNFTSNNNNNIRWNNYNSFLYLKISSN